MKYVIDEWHPGNKPEYINKYRGQVMDGQTGVWIAMMPLKPGEKLVLKNAKADEFVYKAYTFVKR